MPKRARIAELRDRIDGLALAFFAVTGATVEALIEVHPDGNEAQERMLINAYALLTMLEEIDQSVFAESAINQAFLAVTAALSARPDPIDTGNNDNNPGGRS